MFNFSTKEQIFYGVILATIFFMLLTVIIISTAVQFYKRKRAHQLDISKFENQLLQTRLEIQEQTFHNIGQDLHDNVCQILSLIKLNLSTIKTEDQMLTKMKITEAKELVVKTIADIRDLSKTLNTDVINSVGLASSLKLELERLQRNTDIQIEMHFSEETEKLHLHKELVLFRIVQESFQNIIKHADARKILVRFSKSDGYLLLVIADDGRGFDTNLVQEGAGLKNIKSRCNMIGGSCSIKSQPQRGTEIHIRVPIQ